MRAAMYYNNSDIRLEEVPLPQIGSGELLIRIEASGICGSDVMEWYRINKAPLVLGHEIAGVVEEVGEGVTKYRKGDRVCASHHVPCNTCHYCLNGHHTACQTLRTTRFFPGGFAEYVRIPAINVNCGVYPIPDEVSFEEATFTEPVACVFRGQKKAKIQPGQRVLVIGSGISGLLHINMAKALGAGRIIAVDISEYRLNAAQRFGAEHTIQIIPGQDIDLQSRIRELNNGLLADRVIICTGAVPAIEQGLQCVERGGTILLFAPTEPDKTIPLSINDVFWGSDVTITTSYAGSPADHYDALSLIRAKRINVMEMITHRLPLSETGNGFRLVAEAKESIKVIVEPHK
ncbi:alcohol dehydrogenase catalytic domain-containing protein [Candidatus Margulisiibacteriota bacterium]